MTPQQLSKLIKTGEKTFVEFKECRSEISASTFESVCAFLNRSGRHFLHLNELETHTKNPMITRFFKEIGFVEGLGSGRKNIACKFINGAVKNELYSIVEIVWQKPGINRKSLSEIVGKGNRTLDRYLKLLKDTGVIERLGSDKTGGYHLTREVKTKLDSQ